MASKKNGAGRELCPTEAAERKVFAVSDLGFDPCFESFPKQKCDCSKILHLFITDDHVLAWLTFSNETINMLK